MPYRNASDVPDDDESWQPGDYIVPPQNSPQPDIQTLLSDMQSAITTQIQKVQCSLDSLSGRVDQLEDDMKVQLLNASVSSSSPSTDSEGSLKPRTRHVPPDISVSAHQPFI